MRLPAIIILASVAPLQALALTSSHRIGLENPLDKARVDAPVVVSLQQVAPGLAPTSCVVTINGKEIASQLDDLNGDGIADEAAFVVDIPANGKMTAEIELSDDKAQKEYAPRVWGGFMLKTQKKGKYADIYEVTVPGHVDFYNMVQGHGPMFESELVGYRVYFNQKQTLDPYGKFNKGLELEECTFYPNDEQLARGFGDDVLLAGNSCGIGAFKGWNGKEATHIEPVKSRTERLVSAGPVRTIVEVEADDWDYPGGKIDMLNRYTLYAGHRDLQIDVEFDRELGSQEFSTGVERVKGDRTLSWRDDNGLVASWGTHWPVNDTVKYAKETIGIATYLPKKYIAGQADTPDDFMYVVKAPGEKSLRYYTMFTSKKETFGFDDSDSWFGYLPQWRQELENPIKVTIID